MIWVAILVSMLFHELGHAAASTYFGDPAPRNHGRLTLNPFVHISVLWTVILPVSMYVVTHGAFVFGSMRPIPVTYTWLTPSQRYWVAAAGPAVNVALALILLPIWREAATMNVMLAIVNLLPIRPLDGWRMIRAEHA